jgi:hypothetical protein
VRKIEGTKREKRCDIKVRTRGNRTQTAGALASRACPPVVPVVRVTTVTKRTKCGLASQALALVRAERQQCARGLRCGLPAGETGRGVPCGSEGPYLGRRGQYAKPRAYRAIVQVTDAMDQCMQILGYPKYLLSSRSALVTLCYLWPKGADY